MLKYFSMFSGIGGFEYGIGDIGECVGYSEIDKYAEAIYWYHYPEHKGYGNATKINTDDLPDFDLLVGGFPCQSFSIAGKRGGFSDSRGTLFFEIARICADKRPGYILLENVKGLLSHSDGKTFQSILGILSDIGYLLQWEVLNSCNFGVPQNRERVFIIGHLRGTARPKVFPIGEPEGLLDGEGQTLLMGCFSGKYRLNNRELLQINSDKPQGQRVYDPDGLSTGIARNTGGWGRSTGLYAIDTRQTRDGVRVSDNMPCLNKSMAKDMYKVSDGIKIRRLTPLEAERLQAFPDSWTKYGLFDDGIKEISDTQRYKCLGNAVTTSVIREIMQRLKDV